jgi:phenylalanyl-tRNA synthetase beta chain
MGAVVGEGWNIPPQEVDFFYAKGCIERLLAELRAPSPAFIAGQATPYLHPGKGAVIQLDDQEVGVVGELHPEVAFELSTGVFIFELDLPALAQRSLREITFVPLPRFPSVARDVAVTVDEGISAGELMEIMREVDNEYIEAVEVFDCYRGDPIPLGKKGLAFRIRYRSPDRTLTDEEVNEFHQKVLERLERMPALTIR